jgi:hypothetical protein
MVHRPELEEVGHLRLVDFIGDEQSIGTGVAHQTGEHAVIVPLQTAGDGSSVRLGLEDIAFAVPGVDEGTGFLGRGRDCPRDHDNTGCNAEDGQHGFAAVGAPEPPALHAIDRDHQPLLLCPRVHRVSTDYGG